jgi:flagellar hook-basal body complex protein FliE
MKIQQTLNAFAPQPAQSALSNEKAQDVQNKQRPSFSKTLKESIQEVNRLQQEADRAIESLATGETKDIAQTMIAVEKANISFQLMTQVRNRILEAYQEIMRMQS